MCKYARKSVNARPFQPKPTQTEHNIMVWSLDHFRLTLQQPRNSCHRTSVDSAERTVYERNHGNQHIDASGPSSHRRPVGNHGGTGNRGHRKPQRPTKTQSLRCGTSQPLPLRDVLRRETGYDRVQHSATSGASRNSKGARKRGRLETVATYKNNTSSVWTSQPIAAKTCPASREIRCPEEPPRPRAISQESAAPSLGHNLKARNCDHFHEEPPMQRRNKHNIAEHNITFSRLLPP